MKRENMRKYWRSHEELHQTPAFHQANEHEFQDELDVSTPEGTSRRGFLGWVSASLAATGLSGCIRRPEETILPYSKAPEEILPGIPQYYATSADVAGDVIGLLVENHEGRPTKIEGNPLHHASRGATSAVHQALVLDLYDPQRLRVARKFGGDVTTENLVSDLQSRVTGNKVAVLAGAMPSPTLNALRNRWIDSGRQWYTYESVSDDNQRQAMTTLFGQALRPHYHFSLEAGAQANVVLALDSDFLGAEGGSVEAAHEWSKTRRMEVLADGDKLSRLYSVEARYSLTGTNADHRIRASHRQIEAFARAVATKLGLSGGTGGSTLDAEQLKAVDAIVKDLQQNMGKALVLAGRNQPPVVHALAALMNQKLGVQGTLVHYYPDYRRAASSQGDMSDIKALVAQLNAGAIDSLIIMGVNPVYSSPADVNFAEAMSKAKNVIYLADQQDETASALNRYETILIPRAHFLERWGDLVHTDGQVSLVQPLIQPLHAALSEHELIAILLGDGEWKSYKQVRSFWSKERGGVGFSKLWRKALHEGVLDTPLFEPVNAQATGLGAFTAGSTSAPTNQALDVLFFAGYSSFDGRFANNSWLQELPDPLTKITWDNAVLLSPNTAKALNVKDEDVVELKLGEQTLRSVAWVMPGQADSTAVLTLGYGRKFENYLPYHQGSYNDSDAPGFDVNVLRNSSSAFAATGAQLSTTGETYLIAAVQRFANSDQEPGFGFEKRPLVRETDTAALKSGKADFDKFAKPGIIEHGHMPKDHQKYALLHPPEGSIYGDHQYTEGLQWGMVIDLNSCTGCSSCMVSCVSENNISMVGKDQVRRGREMHWIRMDRYFVSRGDEDPNPQVVHQPIACQQCETAPCENVCPVAATVHSPEGLNDMVYNRCIGTRYCANNCPFKVRRFNFYNYAKDQDALIQMQRNPNVTVRFRGVMEKCTYCVQRINKGKRYAALNPEKSQQIIDNIRPACAQSCPSQAITFGDILNKKSRVAQLKQTARDYKLLSELNLQSRTSFLAKIRNPNPELNG